MTEMPVPQQTGLRRLPSAEHRVGSAVTTRLFGWSAAYVALLFIFAGIGHYLKSGFPFTTCLFGKPDCSTAVATWFVAIVTSVAFVAAIEAAIRAGESASWARQTYRLETDPVLGQSLCEDTHHSHARATVWVVSPSIIEKTIPEGYVATDFRTLVDYDFENLGRSAILDLVATLELRFPDGPRLAPVAIGNIGTEKHAHVSIKCLTRLVPMPSAGWSKTSRTATGRLLFKPIDAPSQYRLNFAANRGGGALKVIAEIARDIDGEAPK